MLRGHDGTHAQLLRFSAHDALGRFDHHLLNASLRGHLRQNIPGRTLRSAEHCDDILHANGRRTYHPPTDSIQRDKCNLVHATEGRLSLPEQFHGESGGFHAQPT